MNPGFTLSQEKTTNRFLDSFGEFLAISETAIVFMLESFYLRLCARVALIACN